MNKIPLESRIRRLRSGLCSSPEHILPGLRTFAGMPVMQVIGKLFSDLQKDFENQMSLRYRKPASEITYGDLAVIIAEDYLKNGILSSYMTDSLILFFFTCFETENCFNSIREKQKISMSRDYYLEKLGIQDIKGITDVKAGEFFDAIKGLDIPDPFSRKLYAFSLEKAGIRSMTMLSIYTDLVMYALKYDTACDDPIRAGYLANSTMIRAHMIELFVIPTACATLENEYFTANARSVKGDE